MAAMEQQELTARQRMRIHVAHQRKALLMGKGRVNAARKHLEAAQEAIQAAQQSLERVEIVDLDFPEVQLHLRELALLLQESEEHIDQHIERKKF